MRVYQFCLHQVYDIASASTRQLTAACADCHHPPAGPSDMSPRSSLQQQCLLRTAPPPNADAAVQAAMLDLRLTSALGRLVVALLPALSAGDVQAAAVMTMALEVATVLANPSVCLDPQQPASKRAAQECPPVSEVCSMVQSSPLTSLAA